MRKNVESLWTFRSVHLSVRQHSALQRIVLERGHFWCGPHIILAGLPSGALKPLLELIGHLHRAEVRLLSGRARRGGGAVPLPALRPRACGRCVELGTSVKIKSQLEN